MGWDCFRHRTGQRFRLRQIDPAQREAIGVTQIRARQSPARVLCGQPRQQRREALQARQANHEPLPFAASIFSPDGKEIGVVGQGSMMFISDANAKRAIVKWSGGQCSVDLGQQTTKDSVCR